MKRLYSYLLMAGMGLTVLTGCTDDDIPSQSNAENTGDENYVGKAVGNFAAEEWYPGGELGTTLNITAGCYEDEAPAVAQMGLTSAFNSGEYFFERTFTINTKPFRGLGPASVRKSCLDCHPGYGHGKRQLTYRSTFGNGYLLVVYHPTDGVNSNDGPYISEVTGMPQTQATSPFLPPIDEEQIQLTWKKVTAMESGIPMEFADGEKFELIYPEVFIPASAFNTDPVPTNLAFRLESTIGIMGTGLIDAIPDDSLRKQYQAEAPYVELNPAMWDAAANDWASTAWYTNWTAPGALADGTACTKKINPNRSLE